MDLDNGVGMDYGRGCLAEGGLGRIGTTVIA